MLAHVPPPHHGQARDERPARPGDFPTTAELAGAGETDGEAARRVSLRAQTHQSNSIASRNGGGGFARFARRLDKLALACEIFPVEPACGRWVAGKNVSRKRACGARFHPPHARKMLLRPTGKTSRQRTRGPRVPTGGSLSQADFSY